MRCIKRERERERKGANRARRGGIDGWFSSFLPFVQVGRTRKERETCAYWRQSRQGTFSSFLSRGSSWSNQSLFYNINTRTQHAAVVLPAPVCTSSGFPLSADFYSVAASRLSVIVAPFSSCPSVFVRSPGGSGTLMRKRVQTHAEQNRRRRSERAAAPAATWMCVIFPLVIFLFFFLILSGCV